MYQHESGLFDFRRVPHCLISRHISVVIAMVHELIGLQDNKVDLRSIGSLPKDQQVEVVLSSEQDAFFKSNMYLGILGMNIKRMVDDFQQVAKSNQNIQTVGKNMASLAPAKACMDMAARQRVKATLVTEMSKLVEARKLMLAKELHMRDAVTDLLNNESVSDIDRLRLVMLYALRYEKENPVQLMQLFNKLASRSPKYKPGVMSNLAPFIYTWVAFFHIMGLYHLSKNLGLPLICYGVENVYTQHHPPLFQTMESITRGRLQDVD
ncbi:unnamed protein product [Brassica rapa subsp. trilocularis]